MTVRLDPDSKKLFSEQAERCGLEPGVAARQILELYVQRLREGGDYIQTLADFSAALKALKPGDWAQIDAPYGKFTFEGEHEKIGLLGGGIGITPFKGICQYCTDMHLDTKITLLYGNRTEKDIVFRKELEALQKQNANLKVVFTLNETDRGWQGATGFINANMIKREIPDYEETVFYTCGPPAMVEVMERLIEQLGLPDTQLKREYFTGYT